MEDTMSVNTSQPGENVYVLYLARTDISPSSRPRPSPPATGGGA
jgi:hypothetical protein